jgi:DNA-binding CsgD family transcriptional regulator
MYGEYLATRALTCAVAGEHDNARALISEALDTTSVVEVQTLCAVAVAISTLREHGRDRETRGAFQLAMDLDTWDALVCGIRAEPTLLVALATDSSSRRHVTKLLTRSRDAALLGKMGLLRESLYGHDTPLSTRERDVIALMSRGLTNREIAKTLYISESTAKVHVAHILKKLGARTRADAVIRYAADDANSGNSNLTDST